MKVALPLILVVCEEEATDAVWHVDSDPGGNYGTLCGLSIDDGVNVVTDRAPSRTQKCNCRACFEIWQRLTALKLKRSDFEVMP